METLKFIVKTFDLKFYFFFHRFTFGGLCYLISQKTKHILLISSRRKHLKHLYIFLLIIFIYQSSCFFSGPLSNILLNHQKVLILFLLSSVCQKFPASCILVNSTLFFSLLVFF